MNVIIRIDGRDAIPVRALPLMSPAITPRTVAAELQEVDGLLYAIQLEKQLKQLKQLKPPVPPECPDPDRFAEPKPPVSPEECLSPDEEELLYAAFPELEPDPEIELELGAKPLAGIRAHALCSGIVIEFPDWQWRRVEQAIREVEALQPSTDPYFADTLRLLPAGAFIWMSDFERVYLWMNQIPKRSDEGPPRTACFALPVPGDVASLIMEGFEDLTEPNEARSKPGQQDSSAQAARDAAGKVARRPGPKPKLDPAVEHAEKLIASGMQQTRACLEAAEKFNAKPGSIERSIRRRKQNGN